MIIIETTNGPWLVNDAEIQDVYFERELQTVIVRPTQSEHYKIENVENVQYYNLTCPNVYKWDSSEVEKLKAQNSEWAERNRTMRIDMLKLYQERDDLEEQVRALKRKQND